MATQEQPALKQSMVVYTDGGSRPNPGNGGWGLHGYLYLPEKAKRGAGHPTVIPTTAGYITKAEAKAMRDVELGGTELHEVTVLNYFDGSGSIPGSVTNNIAEIVAMTRAMTLAAQYELEQLIIFADSKYALDGAEKWCEGWKRNNWVKQDGTPVSNVEYWKLLDDAHATLINRGVRVSFQWVHGHNGETGNEIADSYATVGVIYARNGQNLEQINTSPPEKYWNNEFSRHPFILSPCLYFNTESVKLKEGSYFLGSHGKDDEALAVRSADGAYAVVVLKEADPVLELLRNFSCNIARKESRNTLMVSRLDLLFNRDVLRFLEQFGQHSLIRNATVSINVSSVNNDNNVIANELSPARLAWRAIDAAEALETKLEEFLANDPKIIKTDLTSILYQTKPAKKGSKGGETLELKPEYGVGFSSLQVDAGYDCGDGVKQIPVKLVLGIDALNRNGLKRLETMNPKVTLITWSESEGVFRYATVIEADDGYGIWAGYYSNFRYLKPQEAKA